MNLLVWLGNVCLIFVICVTKICRRASGVSKEHLHCHCWLSFLGLEMAAGFRSNIFDPVLIIAQIVATQCFFYLSLGLWLAVADLTGGIQTSVDQIFDHHEFEGSYDGWLVMGAMIINSFTGALALWWVVRRGKQSSLPLLRCLLSWSFSSADPYSAVA